MANYLALPCRYCNSIATAHVALLDHTAGTVAKETSRGAGASSVEAAIANLLEGQRMKGDDTSKAIGFQFSAPD